MFRIQNVHDLINWMKMKKVYILIRFSVGAGTAASAWVERKQIFEKTWFVNCDNERDRKQVIKLTFNFHNHTHTWRFRIGLNLFSAYLSFWHVPHVRLWIKSISCVLCACLVMTKHSCVNNVHTKPTYRFVWSDWLERICVVCIAA